MKVLLRGKRSRKRTKSLPCSWPQHYGIPATVSPHSSPTGTAVSAVSAPPGSGPGQSPSATGAYVHPQAYISFWHLYFKPVLTWGFHVCKEQKCLFCKVWEIVKQAYVLFYIGRKNAEVIMDMCNWEWVHQKYYLVRQTTGYRVTVLKHKNFIIKVRKREKFHRQ